MKVEFDKQKTKDERLLEKAISVLDHTQPEQTTDAMSDYITIMCILKNVKNQWRFAPAQELLNKLYIRPERRLHNELVVELHELKEELHEERIKFITDKQLGNDDQVEKRQKFLGITLLVASGLYLLLKRN